MAYRFNVMEYVKVFCKFIASYFYILALVLPLQACSSSYTAAPIDIWVVDDETGAPLDKVIVTANWQLKGGLEGGNNIGQMKVIEAISDKMGHISFPAWGPIRNTSGGYIREEAPRLLIFKDGYSYLRLFNQVGTAERPGPALTSDWNNKTVRLTKFNGSADEYAEQIYDLNNHMANIFDNEDGIKACNWKRIPQMILTLNDLSLSFDEKGIKLKGWRIGQQILRIESIPTKPHCGSTQDFFRSYLKHEGS